ncbi:MAG: hypothetical protein ACRDBO_15895 [Lachnospiraceae bacterium]
MTNDTNFGGVKRTYKDSLFRKIFGDKEKLLSLYNAVNGTHYDNSTDLRINTLDNAVYLNMKNDISFIFEFSLHLYEHQSTYCANMPLRYLFYITKLFQKEIGEQSFYSPKLIELPPPVFVVFYNGTEEKPERWTEKLSDAFQKKMDPPGLELEVVFLNVNYGKNKNIMEQCQTLEEYAIYVSKVRMYTKTMPIEEAVERAVTECIKENILAEFLARYRAEAIQMSILEYDEEREMKLIRKAQLELGREEGRELGREEGKKEGKIEGKKEGKIEGMADGILMLLSALGPVSSQLSGVIFAQTNPEILKSWLMLAAKADSVELFEKEISKTFV